MNDYDYRPPLVAVSYVKEIIVFANSTIYNCQTLIFDVLFCRKAVKAAIVLLPLLGVTHFSEMISPPTHNAISFGVWSYISHFLSSFQGVFISLLYCFLNSEVSKLKIEFMFVANVS